MITVAIVGILAAVALPAYSDYVLRGNIASMTNELLAVRAKMETYYQDNRTYASTSSATAPCTTTAVSYSKPTYTIACSSITSTTFTATATGSGTMAGFVYTITQADAKTSTLPSKWGGTTGSSCWLTKKGDSC
ncbi:fimbrial assembly protein [Curvibacter sp. CHRR-16]|nr:fimbrial assembly protein [Curvibacter sp. CHRR-16]